MRANARGLAAITALLIALAAAGCAKKAVQAPPQAPPTPAQPGMAAADTTPTPPTPPPTPAPVPGNAELIGQLKPVFFALDSSTLTDDARAALDANAKLLRDNTPLKITVEGHCDERGTSEYNQALGERRAGAARDYLVAAGISAARLQVISYGKERPFADGHDEAAWAQNRRAQFVGQ
jgi:peptidoglycan-associated lipoprotein